jgi:hypothetical protein
MRGPHAAWNGGERWQQFVRRCLEVPVPALQRDIAELRGRYAGESDADLARRVYAGVAWRGAVMAMMSGAPGHLALALPAAFLEAGVAFRMDLIASAKVALIYDPEFFAGGMNPSDRLERLAPLFGGSVQAMAEAKLSALSIKTFKTLTSEIFRHVTRRNLGKVLSKGVAKVFGPKAGRRLLEGMPIAGALVGAAWSIVGARDRGEQVIAHFEWRRAAVTTVEPAPSLVAARPREATNPSSLIRGPVLERRQLAPVTSNLAT